MNRNVPQIVKWTASLIPNQATIMADFQVELPPLGVSFSQILAKEVTRFNSD